MPRRKIKKILTALPGIAVRHAREIVVALLLALVLPPCPAIAGNVPPTGHHHEIVPAPEGASVGLDEHLGGKIPLDLSFRDETGHEVRLKDLITVPTIILPVYYSCTNECYFLQGGLASALPEVKQTPGKDYRVISVSFDETETPALAARYKRMYLASMNTPFPEDGWRFLTGDAQSIRRLTDAAGYRFQRKGRDFIHPVASFVVARDGTIIRYLYGVTFLPKDLTLAFLEARDGTVGATIRTVVGYCFSFDPKGKTYVFNLLRVTATVILAALGVFLVVLILSGRKRPEHSKRK